MHPDDEARTTVFLNPNGEIEVITSEPTQPKPDIGLTADDLWTQVLLRLTEPPKTWRGRLRERLFRALIEGLSVAFSIGVVLVVFAIAGLVVLLVPFLIGLGAIALVGGLVVLIITGIISLFSRKRTR